MFCLSLTLLLIIESVFDKLPIRSSHRFLFRSSLYLYTVSYFSYNYTRRGLFLLIVTLHDFLFLKRTWRFPFTVPLLCFALLALCLTLQSRPPESLRSPFSVLINRS
jgi:hypothetical protein